MIHTAALGQRGVAASSLKVGVMCLSLMLTTLCLSARGNTGYMGLIIDFHIDSSIIYSSLSLSLAPAATLALIRLSHYFYSMYTT